VGCLWCFCASNSSCLRSLSCIFVSSLSASICCHISFHTFSFSSSASDYDIESDEIFHLICVELSGHVVSFSMSGSPLRSGFSLVSDMVLLWWNLF
jgi:hypothetical protein